MKKPIEEEMLDYIYDTTKGSLMTLLSVLDKDHAEDKDEILKRTKSSIKKLLSSVDKVYVDQKDIYTKFKTLVALSSVGDELITIAKMKFGIEL